MNNFVVDNRIFIHGNFDESISSNVIPGFLKLIDRNIPEIEIYINSPGGYTEYVKNMIALVEKAKKNGIIVSTYVYSGAHSCGSILAISGTKGHRYVSENASELIHFGSGGTYSETPLQSERMKEYIDRHFKFILSCYRKYAKVPGLEDKIKDNHYYVYGKDLIKFGMADVLI